MNSRRRGNAALRIAIVGGGIVGSRERVASAQAGPRRHPLRGGDYLGGRAHTIDVAVEGITAPVDTGFLVFNGPTYPKLVALLAELGVESVASEMSFSARIDRRHRTVRHEPACVARAAAQRLARGFLADAA